MTASKQARIRAALKLYEETVAPAAKLYLESTAPAAKLYNETLAKIEAEP